MGIFDGIKGGQGGLANAHQGTFSEWESKQRLAAAQGQQNAYGTQQGLLAQQYTAAARPEADFNPNDHEAWSMAMSTLVNLWRSKYLDAWVLPGNRSDEFWHHAYRRLAEAGKFERAPGSYIRLREDA